ncbi:hypothetical protein M0L20_18155 [Spirosoma sp. RP8]|uniref:DUF4469 domain-containing protein n=1 Tax=Spirosoma liriopis TaxID=2937440 RepID=A0ABT0HP83_9BACT|nr:hypothetical protein [Spirosoma liriopis]MCK8493795.1 hypothetical protein [Spirosoma liriopis]
MVELQYSQSISLYQPMTQQDLTAPVDRVKVSRREQFVRAYQVFSDETTEQDLTSYRFSAELSNNQGMLLALSETSGISRPALNSVVVTLNTIRMGELATGAYTLLLYGVRDDEREIFVQLLMQVEP